MASGLPPRLPRARATSNPAWVRSLMTSHSNSAKDSYLLTKEFRKEVVADTSIPMNMINDPEHWYIVMDSIEGQTLEELLARSPRGRLSVSEVVKIGIALCDVLSYLHDQKPSIIFRDVKPGNIMYTPFIFFMVWLKKRRQKPNQSTVQIPAPLQQHKHP